ncbi:MAG: protein kinase [Planctomycetota bacterium]
MSSLQEIRVRLAMIGADGSGKSAALQAYHELSPQRGPLTAITDRAGHTLLFDHAEFAMGKVGNLPIYVDVYALPGRPEAELARRIVLSGCHGFIFVADARSFAHRKTRDTFEELERYLAGRSRTLESAALVALITHADRGTSGSNKVEIMLRKQLKKERLIRVGIDTRERVGEAIKKAAALALSREKDELEAQRAGKPPPRVKIPGHLIGDIELAHEIYLRAAGVAGAAFSPHSDPFLGQVLLELGGVRSEDLADAIRLKAQALDIGLDVGVDEILLKRELVDPEALPRAHRVRHCVEVIHEEVLFGRIASELDVVPFQRVKRALTLQVKRNFQHSLDHILSRAGQLGRQGRRRVLERLAEVHQEELRRDHEDEARGRVAAGRAAAARDQDGLPLFGEVAVNLGLITRRQAEEALGEQRKLRERGSRRFIGQILRARGYLADDEIPLVCRALETKIADDRIEGYRIIRSLGRGNMALVFAARQLNLDRVVALKILDPKLLFDHDFIERFHREAMAAARLNHPNMVQAYDVGTCQDLHYFAMEYVDGVTVQDLIDDAGAIDQETAIDILIQAARALDHAAKHDLVHRDVKPGNLMVNREGVAKLCDLGLAKRTDEATDERLVLGSPFYISPEQIQARRDVDVRADIYSLGATWFHMLTGRPPFRGPTPEEICLRHLQDPVPDPRGLIPELSPEIPQILQRMMAKERTQRYASPGEIVRDLVRLHPKGASDERQAELAARLDRTYPRREDI